MATAVFADMHYQVICDHAQWHHNFRLRLLINRNLEYFFHDIELLNVFHLKVQRPLASEAESQQHEAVFSHVESAIFLIVVWVRVGGLLKTQNTHSNQLINVSKNIVVTPPKILSNVLAIGTFIKLSFIIIEALIIRLEIFSSLNVGQYSDPPIQIASTGRK